MGAEEMCVECDGGGIYEVGVLNDSLAPVSSTREQKDPVYLRDKVSQKHSKEQFESAQKIEQEYSKFFTGQSTRDVYKLCFGTFICLPHSYIFLQNNRIPSFHNE